MHELVVNKYTTRYDVYIGRGSPWGNPFTHLTIGSTAAAIQVDSREDAIGCYRGWILCQKGLMRRLPTLRGKILGCFCAPKSCHGEVLQELLETYTDEELLAWEVPDDLT